jgi:hypothetical protein
MRKKEYIYEARVLKRHDTACAYELCAISIALDIFSPSPRILQFRNITGVGWAFTIVSGILILL